MLIQPSNPARQTRYQAITQAFLTSTPRAPLEITPEVSQRRAQLNRGPHIEGAAPSRKTFKGPGDAGEEEEENSVEEEGSNGTEGVPATLGNPKVLEGQL
ncbi:hypothetical protein O181_123431 [Austropuccinia psidii MF-1]|uniref:Uncharacterized protein n=1 Tax=Austropuccinia psidii MF-1 TaxID=1389203 RepID=A0A9Q3Q393_9BASI|nr:hypothetical protein [Austropuccinia psidii MF-1]